MKLSEIIKKYRAESKLSMREFAKRCDVSNAYISIIESEENKSPTLDMIAKLAKGMNIQTSDLINMMNDDENVKVKPKSIITKIKPMNLSVHVYGRIPAGTPFEAIQDRLEDIEVPSKYNRKKGLFGLKIIGDSMNRIIPDGAIAIFQQTCELNQGEIGAIMVNGDDATVKHFYKLRDACVLEPDSFNDEHKPIVIDGKNGPEVRIIGKFIWYCMDPSDELK